jgi:hypothetical protein
MRRTAQKIAVGARTSKTCTSCHEDKPVAKFLPSRFTDDRLTDVCKVCTLRNAERDRREREARRPAV